MTKTRLLLATNNAGKIRELVHLLEGIPLAITTPEDEGVVLDVEETGTTFEENAKLKAVAFAAASGLRALSDDSGLEVDALGGAPGIFSARYAGLNATSEQMVKYLLNKLNDVDWARRRATFRSVIAIAEPGGGGVEIFEGKCDGIISLEPHGTKGFGYDPIFYIPSLGRHMAELDLDEKNHVSHRGIAARRVIEFFKKEAYRKE